MAFNIYEDPNKPNTNPFGGTTSPSPYPGGPANTNPYDGTHAFGEQPGNNYYGTKPAFGEDSNKLPGQQRGVGVDPTFDPNALPGAQQSPDGSGAAPGGYTNPNGDPFNQPDLSGNPYGPGIDPNAGKPTGNPNATPGPEAPLAGPGYNEDWYKTYGADLMKTPSASEDLFAKGMAGSNPFYDEAQKQAIKAINDASAARGGFNSSHAITAIGNTTAKLRGLQAHELGQLAGQADAGKFGRYDRGNEYSGDAQDRMENRANSGLDRDIKISGDQANLVQGFFESAGKGYTQAQMAAVEAALKASGLTAAEAKAMMDQAMSIGGIIASFYGGGGGGGGGNNGGAGPTLYA